MALVALLLVAGMLVAGRASAEQAANLDQCANDPAPSLHTDGCAGGMGEQGWWNGNLNHTNSVYYEGDSVPYRTTFSGLSTTGTHTVTIQWDVIENGVHAFDYLTSYDRTVTTANPCWGIAGCDGWTESTYAIPLDPHVSTAGVTQIPGEFTLWGGTILSVGNYQEETTGSTTMRSIDVTFTADVSNPVLAWGGHIATRADWGMGAADIPGASYHMRLLELDGMPTGQQDRSLQIDAVIYPPILHLVKEVVNDDGGTAVARDFTLTATGTIEDNVVTGTSPVHSAVTLKADTFVLSESGPAGYAASAWVCEGTRGSYDDMSTRNGEMSWPVTNGNTITLGLRDMVTCTIINNDTGVTPILTLVKTVVNDNGGTATVGDFTLSATGTIEGNVMSGTSPVLGTMLTADTFALAETGPGGYAASWECTGAALTGASVTVGANDVVVCTVTNNDVVPVLALTKVVVNDDGGTATAADFTLSATGLLTGNAMSGAGSVTSPGTLQADTFSLAETGPAGYTATWVCTGATLIGTSVTLGIGANVACTVTNNDVGGAVAPAGGPAIVVAPPTGPTPVLLPPARLRGTAMLAGPRGCVAPGVVMTRVRGRNIANVRFYRDGRLVKRVNVNSSRLRTVMLATRIGMNDYRLHNVTARVRFTAGSTPAARVMTHRFGQCVASSVTG